jgi:hypothetical protein
VAGKLGGLSSAYWQTGGILTYFQAKVKKNLIADEHGFF